MSEPVPANSAAARENLAAWKNLVRRGHRLTRAARDEDFSDPLASVDGPGWLGGDIRGQRVLCLAAGGGRQGPLYAAAGAEVTVVDFCQELLDQDREVADQRRLQLRTLRTCMSDLSALESASIDLVVHPVSTCYVPDIQPVFREVSRVLRPGGLYVSQHKQPASLQSSLEPAGDGTWRVIHASHRTGPLPVVTQDSLVREPGAGEYVHSWQAIVGGICRAGFVIEDLAEPFHADPSAPTGSFAHRSSFLPPYVRIKARRTGGATRPDPPLWVPAE